MNESEMIARWLGCTPRTDYPGQWNLPGLAGPQMLPNFRTSNEWAGTVLEKLPLPCLYHGKSGHWQLTIFTKDDGSGNVTVHAKDWRSAVVDAALEVIKRET